MEADQGYWEQNQVVASWRIWTRDLQISNPAPQTTQPRCHHHDPYVGPHLNQLVSQ